MQNNTYEVTRLDAVHGYRLDGDNVELNARVVLGAGASLANWKLQLWAKDVLTGAGSGSIKVAEVNLETAQVNAGVAHLQTRLDATLPPTGRYYDMALVLTDDGADTPVDVAKYGERQWITGPFLQGAVGYAVTGGGVAVTVEQVCNPRAQGNLSGTLALELWATAEPYVGGVVRGHQLAGVVLGTLDGQTSRSDVSAQLDFATPPAGQWHVVLMLREWTAAGYVTRDYRSFDAPYLVPASSLSDTAVESERAADAVEALSVVESAVRPTAAQPTAVQPTAVQPTAVQPAASKASTESSGVGTQGAAASVAKDARVSVQTASVEQLMQVKGITKKVAQEIVRARPFKTLEELTRVKGIGDKTLRALRHAIKL
jgi:competence ComEA-like helix-hairpin-helix protein